MKEFNRLIIKNNNLTKGIWEVMTELVPLILIILVFVIGYNIIRNILIGKKIREKYFEITGVNKKRVKVKELQAVTLNKINRDIFLRTTGLEIENATEEDVKEAYQFEDWVYKNNYYDLTNDDKWDIIMNAEENEQGIYNFDEAYKWRKLNTKTYKEPELPNTSERQINFEKYDYTTSGTWYEKDENGKWKRDLTDEEIKNKIYLK